MIGNPLQLIQYLYEQEKEKKFELKEFKEKRNKDQNSKYWKLLGELSLKLKIGIEELHFRFLKEYSPRYQILLPENVELFGIEYYEKKSKIIKDNKEFSVYYVYKPSHEMTTGEFAMLLQGLCDDCKSLGIEVENPDEIKRVEASINGK